MSSNPPNNNSNEGSRLYSDSRNVDFENLMNEAFERILPAGRANNEHNSPGTPRINPFFRNVLTLNDNEWDVPRTPESSPQPGSSSPMFGSRYNIIYRDGRNSPRSVDNRGRRWNSNRDAPTHDGNESSTHDRDLRITNDDNRHLGYEEGVQPTFIKPENPLRENRETYNLLPEDSLVVPNKPLKVNQITNVDLAIKANTELHHTIKFDIVRREEVLVIRRGQPFTIQVSFKDSFDPNNHGVRLVFDIGQRSSIIHGTKHIIEVETQLDALPIKHWGARQRNIQGNRAWLECVMAPNTPVGVWRLELHSYTISNESVNNITPKGSFKYKTQKPIFVLFNPWNKNDMVYVEDEIWRNEGVVRDVGKIWMGTTHDIHSRMWSYGQYEENVLNATCYALDMTRMPYENRGNPVEVVRAISAIVNSADNDRGVIEGNWSGNYNGGTPPTEWQGSVQILQKYYKTRHPVKFGQCWVFAGLTTTILRCLGIPTRTITNFNSAHDTNSNLTVDQIFNEKMEYVEKLNTDSIWNFHVWNECYLARPDLPKGYGGWQLLDSTPQERSSNIFRCGPVSIKAIRNGEVGLQFDTGFAFAEVNADVLSWIMKSREAQPALLERDENRVGHFISCVKPNSNSNIDDDRLDLTSEYKPEEKTAENKASVLNAMNVSKSNTLIPAYGSVNKDVEFNLGDLTTVPLGKDLNISAKMRNISRKTRTITITIHLYTVYYTGVIHQKIKSEVFENLRLNIDENKQVIMLVRAEDYLNILKDGCNFHVTCLGVVAETNQVYSAVDDFSIGMPIINIKVSGGTILKLNKPATINATFTNPLKTPLTHCKWILEGPGIKKPKEIQSNDIPGENLAELEAIINAKDTGNKTILLSFTSKQLNDIEGYLHVRVVQ